MGKYVGNHIITKQGYKLMCVGEDGNRLLVKFEDSPVFSVAVPHYNIGNVSNHNVPSLYDTGFLGYGIHKTKEDKKFVLCYTKWSGMITRCYSNKLVDYMDCVVDSHWHNYQNFGDWWLQQTITKSDLVFDLDKDLLVKDNKVYSERTCSLLPKEIHHHISTNKKNKNTELPKGVVWVPDKKKYRVVSSIGGEVKHRGIFPTKEEALECYLHTKISYAALLVDKYDNYLSDTQKEALISKVTYL